MASAASRINHVRIPYYIYRNTSIRSLQPRRGLRVEVQQDGRDQDVGARRQRAQVGQEGGVDRDDTAGGQAARLRAVGWALVVSELARHGLERGARHRVV